MGDREPELLELGNDLVQVAYWGEVNHSLPVTRNRTPPKPLEMLSSTRTLQPPLKSKGTSPRTFTRNGVLDA